MSDSAAIFLFLPGLFLGIALFIEAGRWLGKFRAKDETERERVVLISIETAIYALLGLMVAFTFSGAAGRFDLRRTLTVDEANAIGTAYLRLDVLPGAAQPALREEFRRYTAERLAVYRSLPDVAKSDAHSARAAAMQSEMWADAVTALKDAPQAASLLVLPALNEMFDITTTRSITMRTHIPLVVLGTLLVLTMVCSLMIGQGLARRRGPSILLHTFGFAVVLTVTMYVIIDLDHPRVGLIRIDYVDQALTDVLNSMK
jgi:hypothetical protein